MYHVSDRANMCNHQLVLCTEISYVPQYDNKSTLVKLLESDLPANQNHALEQSIPYLTSFQENLKGHYKACHRADMELEIPQMLLNFHEHVLCFLVEAVRMVCLHILCIFTLHWSIDVV